jgi:hypothetical protein
MGELADNQTEASFTVNQCIKSEWPSLNKVWKVTLVLKGNYWPPKSTCGLHGKIFICMSQNSNPKASLPWVPASSSSFALKKWISFLGNQISAWKRGKVYLRRQISVWKAVLISSHRHVKDMFLSTQTHKRYAIVNSASKAWRLFRCLGH